MIEQMLTIEPPPVSSMWRPTSRRYRHRTVGAAAGAPRRGVHVDLRGGAAARVADAGVVPEHVDAPVATDARRDDAPHVVLDRHVAGHDRDRRPLRSTHVGD